MVYKSTEYKMDSIDCHFGYRRSPRFLSEAKEYVVESCRDFVSQASQKGWRFPRQEMFVSRESWEFEASCLAGFSCEPLFGEDSHFD